MSSFTAPPGLSASDAQLFEHLVSHAARENSIIERYKELADRGEGYIGLLTGLIAEDEEQHHRLFELWAQSLAAAAALKLDSATALFPSRNPAAFLEAVETLLDFEKTDAAELKRMAKDFRNSKEINIWGLVLEVMRADTAKHILILTYIGDRLRQQLREQAQR